MNKTKQNLINELKIIEENIIKYPEQFTSFDSLEKMNKIEEHLIQRKCSVSNCSNHSIINYKRINYHTCFDNWSSIKVGWHIIYFETLDLCCENKSLLKQ